MSLKVDLGELAERLAEYGFAYLVTVGENRRAHLLAVLPDFDGAAMAIGGVGKHSLANVADHPFATLVWPPVAPGGYSLIVDGTASADDDAATIVVTPTKAILHRPAVDPDGKRAGSDCQPVAARDG